MTEDEAKAKLIPPVQKGTTVVVARGRKVPRGTVGVVMWEGDGEYGPRVGLAVEGEDKLVYTAHKNVDSIYPGLMPGQNPEGGWAELYDRVQREQLLPQKGAESWGHQLGRRQRGLDAVRPDGCQDGVRHGDPCGALHKAVPSDRGDGYRASPAFQRDHLPGAVPRRRLPGLEREGGVRRHSARGSGYAPLHPSRPWGRHQGGQRRVTTASSVARLSPLSSRRLLWAAAVARRPGLRSRR